MKNEALNERRNFLKQVATLGVESLLPTNLMSALPVVTSAGKEGDGYTFLFEGDSITDGNRTRNADWNHVMGHGYQYIIAGKLWHDFPKKGFHFFNRGVSGNKVTDLAARWQKDTIDLKPDLLSILIGINDSSALLYGDKSFTIEQYETGYRNLLQQTKEQLPNIRFVLCEPFVLPVGKVKEKWDEYSTEVKKRGDIV